MNYEKISIFFNLMLQSILSIVKVLILSKIKTSIIKVRIPKKECIILANGPSLRKDIELYKNKLSNYSIMCVNLFALSEIYTKIKPDFYVLAAPEFWLERTTEFMHKSRENLLHTLIEKTNWELVLFLPFRASKSQFYKELQKNDNIRIIFFNDTPIEGFNKINFLLFKYNLGMPRPHNVLIPSIFLGINIGFKKIYIMGADHSWHEEIKIDTTNSVTINHEHFYDKSEVRMPMYKLDGKPYHIHDIFRKLHYAFKGYFILEEYSKYRNTSIINISTKSYIDAFQRGNLI
ncbi:6-hydroxymethylpterin diphosphokinase MptE-like protein [Melioribacter sp. OK-6-Me]|uniref:6-hydroxymethylpterin diphosphokinase MptE-like protein n=1 Tax=unclassified Melioribacter TaxID=2627329 RepID=UPI003EDB03FA